MNGMEWPKQAHLFTFKSSHLSSPQPLPRSYIIFWFSSCVLLLKDADMAATMGLNVRALSPSASMATLKGTNRLSKHRSALLDR